MPPKIVLKCTPARSNDREGGEELDTLVKAPHLVGLAAVWKNLRDQDSTTSYNGDANEEYIGDADVVLGTTGLDWSEEKKIWVPKPLPFKTKYVLQKDYIGEMIASEEDRTRFARHPFQDCPPPVKPINDDPRNLDVVRVSRSELDSFMSWAVGNMHEVHQFGRKASYANYRLERKNSVLVQAVKAYQASDTELQKADLDDRSKLLDKQAAENYTYRRDTVKKIREVCRNFAENPSELIKSFDDHFDAHALYARMASNLHNEYVVFERGYSRKREALRMERQAFEKEKADLQRENAGLRKKLDDALAAITAKNTGETDDLKKLAEDLADTQRADWLKAQYRALEERMYPLLKQRANEELDSFYKGKFERNMEKLQALKNDLEKEHEFVLCHLRAKDDPDFDSDEELWISYESREVNPKHPYWRGYAFGRWLAERKPYLDPKTFWYRLGPNHPLGLPGTNGS